MATTLGAAHGIDRRCVMCGLTYRYPGAKTFECKSCGARQSWDQPKDSSAPEALPRDPGVMPKPDDVTAIAPIDLAEVLRTLNSMSSDGIRQLHDRLAVLSLVHETNRWRLQEIDHFILVKRVLSNYGVKL